MWFTWLIQHSLLFYVEQLRNKILCPVVTYVTQATSEWIVFEFNSETYGMHDNTLVLFFFFFLLNMQLLGDGCTSSKPCEVEYHKCSYRWVSLCYDLIMWGRLIKCYVFLSCVLVDTRIYVSSCYDFLYLLIVQAEKVSSFGSYSIHYYQYALWQN